MGEYPINRTFHAPATCIRWVYVVIAIVRNQPANLTCIINLQHTPVSKRGPRVSCRICTQHWGQQWKRLTPGYCISSYDATKETYCDDSFPSFEHFKAHVSLYYDITLAKLCRHVYDGSLDMGWTVVLFSWVITVTEALCAVRHTPEPSQRAPYTNTPDKLWAWITIWRFHDQYREQARMNSSEQLAEPQRTDLQAEI